MATISSLGIGSGLDSESIVTKLAALEKAPLANLQTQQKLEEGKISVFGQIQSQFAALQDAATSLSTATAFKTTKASSSNSTAASITSSSTAKPTSFTLDVDALAKTQTTTSAAVTTGSYVGAGTMTLRMGTWSGAVDNTGVASAAAALAAAQTAFNTATTNKTNADNALTTATSDKATADGAYTTAASDAAGPDATLAAANSTLATAQTAYNSALTAFNTATTTQAAKLAAYNAANTAKTNADSALTTANSAYSAAQTDTATKLSQYGTASIAASSAVNNTLTGALAGASKLATFAAGTAGLSSSELKTYSDAYTAWTNAVAANDRSSPTLQAVEDAALAAFNQASTALQNADTANGTDYLSTQVPNQLAGYTTPSQASTLKADAATKLSTYNTAAATEASALATKTTATATQLSAANTLTLATAERDAADTNFLTAQTDLTNATSARNTAVADQASAAAAALPFDTALATATTSKTMAQTAYDAAVAAAAAAATALATAQTNLTSAQTGTTSARPTFAVGSGSDVAITVTATDTVSTLADKINAANMGVVATVFRTGSTERLQLTSKNTGAAAGFRVQVTDTDGNNTDEAGLSRFAFDPQVSAYGMGAAANPVTYAQDAKARINGLAVTSATNTFTDNVPGVTVTVAATTTTNYNNVGGTEARNPITMSVSEDVTPSVKSVDTFVKAYNALAANLTDLTKYDAATKTPGAFQGDASVNGLLSILRGMVGSVSTGSAYTRLSDVGIQMQRDGTLTVDTIKLSAAANNGEELTNLFTKDNKNAATNGFALKFAALAKGVLGTGGAVANKATALQKELKTNATEQQKVNDRAAAVEARLRKQYAALDAQMAKLNSLNAYVAQQVTTWNKSTG